MCLLIGEANSSVVGLGGVAMVKPGRKSNSVRVCINALPKSCGGWSGDA